MSRQSAWDLYKNSFHNPGVSSWLIQNLCVNQVRTSKWDAAHRLDIDFDKYQQGSSSPSKDATLHIDDPLHKEHSMQLSTLQASSTKNTAV